MKNPLAHLTIDAPFNLLKSIMFHFNRHTKKLSVSRSYLGLCCYMQAFTSLHLEERAVIEFKKNGFLVLGTERSSFRDWAGRSRLYIREGGRLTIEGYNQIGRGSLVWILEGGHVVIKGNSFTAGKSMIISKKSVEIGQNCSIAWGVTISDHDFHETFVKGELQPETKPVKICDGVWIGMNATILKGVTIGESAIVAAGSVVTRSVPPRAMVAGIPAKVIKRDVEFCG